MTEKGVFENTFLVLQLGSSNMKHKENCINAKLYKFRVAKLKI